VKNLCGKCTICCFLYRIDKSEIKWKDGDKKAGEWCDKLVNNRCVIYKKRPKTCKSYKCLWIQLSELKKNEFCPLKWRPDNLGINVNTSHNEKNEFIFNIEELEKGKLDFHNSEILSFIDMIFKLKDQQKQPARVILYYFGEDKGHQITQK
jgi:hypothetical protein